MTAERKCPFCSGKLFDIDRIHWDGKPFEECLKCSATGPEAESVEEAKKAFEPKVSKTARAWRNYWMIRIRHCGARDAVDLLDAVLDGRLPEEL